ncbi:hypothetical protein [Planktotalea sp.]|uniref:hypothetical protein n=1 Tax=Planktotalea sp. TaxID=2029877 RepID=UPI0032975873
MAQANNKWAQLAELAQLAYDKELAKLSALWEAEAKLVERRQRLNAMNEQAMDDLSEPHPALWHNGDVLWQTWVNQNGRAIGMEQARLKALAEFHKPELRKAFGRKSVLESLSGKKTR